MIESDDKIVKGGGLKGVQVVDDGRDGGWYDMQCVDICNACQEIVIKPLHKKVRQLLTYGCKY